MITRCFSPPLSVGERRSSRASVPVAASASRAIAEVLLALELEGAEVRVPAHQHDFEHRVVEGEVGLLRHDRDASRDLAPGDAGQVAPVDHHAARRRRQHAAQQPQQRGLSRAVRPEDADQVAGRDLQRHAVKAGQSGAVDEADISGLQQPGPRSSHCGRAPETRTSPRTDRLNRLPIRPITSTARTIRHDAPTSTDENPGFVNRPPHVP